MKFHYRLLLAFLLLCCTALSAWAKGPVWKISKGESLLYLGGTIHMLSKADYPLPAIFDQAYAQAAKLVLETDLDRFHSSEFQRRLAKQARLTEGRTLRDILRPETWREVEAFVAARDMDMDNLWHLKPSMLDLILTLHALRRLGLDEIGVDQFYLQRAKAEQKSLGELENPEVQLELLTGKGAGQADAMIKYSLAELKRLPTMIVALKAAWRRGDLETMAQLAVAPWREKFPERYQELLVKRNRNWVPRIEALLQTPEVELVLVGALHLAGPDGILQQMAARGYKIEQL